MSKEVQGERRYLRVLVLKPSSVLVGHRRIEADLRDISLCGAFVVTDESIEEEKPVELVFTLPDREGTLSAKGRIARISHGGSPLGEPSGWGIDFDKIGKKTRQAVDEYVRNTFRAFKMLKFELSKTNPDMEIAREMLTKTYLHRNYTPESLKDEVSTELEKFRLRGKEKMGKGG